MGLPRWTPDYAHLRRLSGRIPSLPKTLTNRFRPSSPAALGGGLVIASIILGSWAQKIAQQEASSIWENAHAPSPLLWKYTLESQGLRSVQDPKLLQRILRQLPAMLDDTGSIWISQDRHWVVIFESQVYGSPGFPLSVSPQSWDRVGVGWTGFEKVLQRLEESGSIQKKSSALIEKKKRIPPFDLREIRY